MKVKNIHCRCGCGFRAVHPIIFGMVMELEWEINIPITVLTICRCPFHNEKVGGSKDSGHMGYYEAKIKPVKWAKYKLKHQRIITFSVALDCTSRNNKRLYAKAIKLGWNGVIWYVKKNMVHLDLKPRAEPFHRIID